MSLKSTNRIYQIDLFRFLAALFVVFFHYFFRGYSADKMSNLNFSEIGNFFKYGYLGVDIFFIISGFVISLSIRDRSLINFFISRISRLYPIYWISVLFTFIVIIFFGAPRYVADTKQFIANLTMFQNYMGIESMDAVYWTLYIEMKFYIFVIGSYLILNKFKEIKLDYLIYSWLSLSLIYPFLDKISFINIADHFFFFNWSSYFISGIIFYQIYKSKLNSKYAILLSISFLLSLYHAISRIKESVLHYNTEFSPYVISVIIVLFYLLMLAVSCKKLNNINYPGLTKIGILTYPLYLIHENIGFIIFNNLENYVNKYVLVISTTILMIFLSYILSEFYEPRMSRYLKLKLERITKMLLKKNKKTT